MNGAMSGMKCLFGIILILGLGSPIAWGQITAEISGTVTDSTGALLPGVELNWKWAMVPLTNIALAIKELVKGTMDYSMLIAIFGSSFFIALVFLLFCAKWFERESVIFRE